MDSDAPSGSSVPRVAGVRRRRAAASVPAPVLTRHSRRLAESIIRPALPDVDEDAPAEAAAGPSGTAAPPPTRRTLPGAHARIPDLLGPDLSSHPSAYLAANEVPEFTQPRGNWFSIYPLYHALHPDYRGMVDSWGFRHFFTIAPRRCPWGYMRALSERWFHQTQSLHLLDCELLLTPLDWRYITGVEFSGPRVPLESDITPAAVRSLLGFSPQEKVFKARSIRSGALAVDAIGGVLSEPFPADRSARDFLLRRLFLTIMRGCFLGNNSSTIHFSIVGATRDVDRIGDYDWGSFTFAYFLHGLRLRSEGQTDAWLGFYPFLLVSHIHCAAFHFVSFLCRPWYLCPLFLVYQFWAYERLPCLRPVTTLGPETYPRGRRWHHSTLAETPVSDSFAHCRLQLELISSADVTWVPYTADHLAAGLAGGYAADLELALSTRRIPFLTYGGWELYLGERAIRCVTGEARVPFAPPSQRFWFADAHLPEALIAGEDGYMLSAGPHTSESFSAWWRPRTIGPQTRATFFLGDLVHGSVMMADWMECVRVPTHSDQIASLTRQVDQLSLFVRRLGRDPEEAYVADPHGSDFGAGPGPSEAPIPFYSCPDLNCEGEASLPPDLPADQFEDDAFIDGIEFTD